MMSDDSGGDRQDPEAEQESSAFAWEQLLSGLLVGAGLLISGYGVYATLKVRSFLSDLTSNTSPDFTSPSNDMQVVVYTAQMLMVVAMGLGVAALGFIWRRMTA